MFSLSFPMHSFLMLTFFSSFWLTWLADPALVTLVYLNQTQYTPHVLQEASLLDGCERASCYAPANRSRTVPKF